MPKNIRDRVREAAVKTLKKEKSVGPLELLMELGFLHFWAVKQWQNGNSLYPNLESHIQCGEKKLKQTYQAFLQWVHEEKLEPFSAQYVAATRNGANQLQISTDGDPEQEVFFRTHFRSAALTEKQKERIDKKQNKTPDLVVFQLTGKPTDCHECGESLQRDDLFLLENNQSICLHCGDLAHLEFLPKGDATLTRRARKHSPLSAIVNRFDSRRKRYQRQGILVTAQAIDAAHSQNESDADNRARQRKLAAVRRSKQDQVLVQQMKTLILQDFPGCPADEAEAIAAHTAVRGSGRVGRSAAGRDLQTKAIELAVNAWIRHQHTQYDQLLASGVERMDARQRIGKLQSSVRQQWRIPPAAGDIDV